MPRRERRDTKAPHYVSVFQSTGETKTSIETGVPFHFPASVLLGFVEDALGFGCHTVDKADRADKEARDPVSMPTNNAMGDNYTHKQ